MTLWGIKGLSVTINIKKHDSQDTVQPNELETPAIRVIPADSTIDASLAPVADLLMRQ